ncbi:MAG: hypothetical protein ACLQIJ_06545 [Polyangia bacterium]
MAANTVILDKQLRYALLQLTGEKGGIANAARILKVSRQTLERAANGLNIQRGTAALFEQKLAAREKARATT